MLRPETRKLIPFLNVIIYHYMRKDNFLYKKRQFYYLSPYKNSTTYSENWSLIAHNSGKTKTVVKRLKS